MEKIWNTIVSFFTTTLPTFVMENLVLFCVSAGLFVLCIILLIVLGCKNKKYEYYKGALVVSKKSEEEVGNRLQETSKNLQESNARCNRLLSEKSTLEENFEELENKFNESDTKNKNLSESFENIKGILAEKEIELSSKIAECQEKDTKISNMSIEKDAYTKAFEENKETILKLTLENTKLEADNGALKLLKESNESLIKDLKDKNSELEAEKKEVNRLLTVKTDVVSEYERKVINLSNENERLKDFEYENQILTKMLRRGETKTAETSEITEISPEVPAELPEMIVINETPEEYIDELDALKRSELSKIARELGIRNYATWTNEALKAEIRNRKQ